MRHQCPSCLAAVDLPGPFGITMTKCDKCRERESREAHVYTGDEPELRDAHARAATRTVRTLTNTSIMQLDNDTNELLRAGWDLVGGLAMAGNDIYDQSCRNQPRSYGLTIIYARTLIYRGGEPPEVP